MSDISVRPPRVVYELGPAERLAEWTLPSGTRFRFEDGYWWAFPAPDRTDVPVRGRRCNRRWSNATDKDGGPFTEVVGGAR